MSGIRVVVSGWRRSTARVFDSQLFLWIWVVFVGVFFSLSSSKLIPYVLPAFPALALLIGGSSPTVLRRDLRVTAAMAVIAALGLAAAGLWASRWVTPSDRSAYFLELDRPLYPIAALLGLTGLYVLLQRRREITRDAMLLGAGWCIAGLLLMRAAAAVAPVYSGVGLARALAAIPPTAPVYSVATFDQTLPFYWQRTVTLGGVSRRTRFWIAARPSCRHRSDRGFRNTMAQRTRGFRGYGDENVRRVAETGSSDACHRA